MKALLLRVGIDKGTDGALGPIFEDGSFEYIPMSEKAKSTETRTFKNTIGRSGQPLSTYLPKKIEHNIMHYDPEFETLTYGDPTAKREYLLKLEKEDLLVFYAGLAPYKNSKYKEALYIIGYFTIKDVIDFNQLSEPQINECYRLYSNNAHLKRIDYPEDLVIVIGQENRSKLLDKAVLISQTKYDKNGKPYQALSNEMQNLLGISGAIQRSVPPRFIRQKENLANLKRLLRIS